MKVTLSGSFGTKDFGLQPKQELVFPNTESYDSLKLEYPEEQYEELKLNLKLSLAPYFRTDSLRKLFFDRLNEANDEFVLKRKQDLESYIKNHLYIELTDWFVGRVNYEKYKEILNRYHYNNRVYAASEGEIKEEYKRSFVHKSISKYRMGCRQSLMAKLTVSGSLSLFKSKLSQDLNRHGWFGLSHNFNIRRAITPSIVYSRKSIVESRFFVGLDYNKHFYSLKKSDSLFVNGQSVIDTLQEYYSLIPNRKQRVSIRDISAELSYRTLFYSKSCALEFGVGYPIFSRGDFIFAGDDEHLENNHVLFREKFTNVLDNVSDWQDKIYATISIFGVSPSIKHGYSEAGMGGFIGLRFYYRNFVPSSRFPVYRLNESGNYSPIEVTDSPRKILFSIRWGLRIAVG